MLKQQRNEAKVIMMYKILNNLVFEDNDLEFNKNQTRGHPFKLKTYNYHDSFFPQPLFCGAICQLRLLLVIA